MQAIHLGHCLEDLYKYRNMKKRLLSLSFEYKILEGNFVWQSSKRKLYHLTINNTIQTEGDKYTQGLRRWQRLLDYSLVHILLPKSQPTPPTGPTDLSVDRQLTQKLIAMSSLITKSLFFSSSLIPLFLLFFLLLLHFLILFSSSFYLVGIIRASMTIIYYHY